MRSCLLRDLKDLLEKGEDHSVYSALKVLSVKYPKTTLKALHDAFRRLKPRYPLHIVGWERHHTGPANPVYRWGEGTDKPRPPPRTNAYKVRKYKDRLQKNFPELYRARARKYAFKQQLKNGAPTIHDPIVMILLGHSRPNKRADSAILKASKEGES